MMKITLLHKDVEIIKNNVGYQYCRVSQDLAGKNLTVLNLALIYDFIRHYVKEAYVLWINFLDLW